MTPQSHLILLLLLISSTLPGPVENRRTNKHKDLGKYCLTPGCVKAAAAIINNIDNTVNPCTDFYDFACGNFIKETVIPDHKTAQGAFSLARDKLNERLRLIFESMPEAGSDDPEVFSSVRGFYKSCMDQDYIEENSRQEIIKIMNELGGWPVILGKNFTGDKFIWQKLEEKANRLGFSPGNIISFGISVNADNSTKRIMEIDQPRLGLNREYLIKGFEDKDVQAYYRYMVNTAVYLGADKVTAEKELKDSLLFEIKLAKISLPQEKRRNLTSLNNQMTLAEASKLHSGYDWVDHINNIIDNKNVTVKKDEVVNVAAPKFFRNVKGLLRKVSARVLANLIMWRFVKSSMSYLDNKALDIVLEYNKVLSGKAQKEPRWEKCVLSTSGNDGSNLVGLMNAVGSMYARKYFPLENKNIADAMVKDIRWEFKVMLDELDWMDNKTRSRAHVKVDKMLSHIAYPKEILDKNLIDQFYQGLKLDSPCYFINMLRLKRSQREYFVKEFRQPINKTSWKTHGGAAVVNAFYDPTENSIEFPAGILDGVFFMTDRPKYMNYGGIGNVVGHEITHGFDDEGSQRDGDGNLVDWWEKKTKQKYMRKAICIIDQYSNYTVDIDGETLNVNGINTLGENIADHGGYKEAYRAYNRHMKSLNKKEGLLPGLNYTQQQFFWLSGAAVWCSKQRPAALKNSVLTGVHSPNMFRVNGPYSNLPEFSKDWNCPVGSPMNPAKKCTVW